MLANVLLGRQIWGPLRLSTGQPFIAHHCGVRLENGEMILRSVSYNATTFTIFRIVRQVKKAMREHGVTEFRVHLGVRERSDRQLIYCAGPLHDYYRTVVRLLEDNQRERKGNAFRRVQFQVLSPPAVHDVEEEASMREWAEEARTVV